MLNAIALVLQVVASLVLILLVLLHAGKGGGMSDMFGGTGGSLSGGTAMERRLDRITVITAVIFGITTFFLAYQTAQGNI